MENETAELDRLQAAYKAAVEEWIVAIRKEAHFDEDDARNKVLALKVEYEDALRRKFFDF
jgi:hypothetical protein